jgi:hypothetical protein
MRIINLNKEQPLNYSMYGGLASGFTEGIKSGYNFVDDAKTKAQNREIQQQQAKQQAEIRAQQIKKAQNENYLTGAMIDDANGVQMETDRRISEIESQNRQMSAEVTKSEVTNPLTLAPNSKARGEQLPSSIAKLRKMPNVVKTLGIQNLDTADVLRAGNPKDIEWATNMVMEGGTSPESIGLDMNNEADRDKWAEYMGQIVESYPAIKVDGQVIDMHALSVAMGAQTSYTPAQRKLADDNRKNLNDIFDSMTQTSNMPKEEVANMTPEDYQETRQLAEETATVDTATDTTPRKGGSRSWRNKNPGNIEAGQFADANGSIGSDGRFAIFPTEEAGHKAMSNLLFEGKNYKNKTLRQAIARYAPSSENNVPAYIRATGADPDMKMKDFSPEQRKTLLANMKKHEGWKEGSVSSTNNEADQIVQESIKTGKPIDDMRMRKLYAIAGKTYPGTTSGKATSKMKDFQFLQDSLGLSKEEAMKSAFGIGKEGNSSRKQVGYKKAIKANIAYQEKLDAGETLSKADKTLMKANNEIIEDFEDTSHQQNVTSDLDTRAKGRTASNEALSTLRSTNVDKDIKANSIRKLDEAQAKLRQVDPKAYKAEGKTIETMKDTQVTLNSLADVLNRVESGDLQKTDTGIVADTWNKVVSYMSEDVKKQVDSVAGTEWRKTNDANIKQNVSLGLLQAEFIKSISGATVTDEERKILLDTIKGGDWADETTLKTALTEFYNVQSKKHANRAKQLENGVSPYDGYRYGILDPLPEGKSYTKSTSVIPSKPTGKTVTKANITESLGGW